MTCKLRHRELLDMNILLDSILYLHQVNIHIVQTNIHVLVYFLTGSV